MPSHSHGLSCSVFINTRCWREKPDSLWLAFQCHADTLLSIAVQGDGNYWESLPAGLWDFNCQYSQSRGTSRALIIWHRKKIKGTLPAEKCFFFGIILSCISSTPDETRTPIFPFPLPQKVCVQCSNNFSCRELKKDGIRTIITMY